MELAADAREILEQWNRCHGAFYRVSESDLRWNLTEQAWVRYQFQRLAGVPVMLGSATAEGAATGISPKTLWLSLYGEIPAGRESDLVSELLACAESSGKTRITVGGDEFHFVAGVPVDETGGARLAAELARRGFTAAEAADFTGSMRAAGLVTYVEKAQVAAKEKGFSLSAVTSAEEERLLGEYLLREFRGRWEREFRCWQSRTDTERAFWNLLRDGSGAVVGFSRLALRGKMPDFDLGWNPGALRLPLREAGEAAGYRRYADSCLGPIGVSATERGRGTGKILLGLSLGKLRELGAEDLCIDWTNAYNYYIPLGVQISRKFHSLWKDLATP